MMKAGSVITMVVSLIIGFFIAEVVIEKPKKMWEARCSPTKTTFYWAPVQYTVEQEKELCDDLAKYN